MRLKRQLQRRQISITWATSALRVHRSAKDHRLEGVDDPGSNTSELDRTENGVEKAMICVRPLNIMVVELFGGVEA